MDETVVGHPSIFWLIKKKIQVSINLFFPYNPFFFLSLSIYTLRICIMLGCSWRNVWMDSLEFTQTKRRRLRVPKQKSRTLSLSLSLSAKQATSNRDRGDVVLIVRKIESDHIRESISISNLTCIISTKKVSAHQNGSCHGS